VAVRVSSYYKRYEAIRGNNVLVSDVFNTREHSDAEIRADIHRRARDVTSSFGTRPEDWIQISNARTAVDFWR
jgi:hypothetical protein